MTSLETTNYLSRLGETAERAGARDTTRVLQEITALFGTELSTLEATLTGLSRTDTPVHRSAGHLVAAGGKRLRPLSVLLAARVAGELTDATREIALVVELVHSATLLHDDVVDVGELRRGRPSARVLYGNAASVFAGDWLLVEALRRLARSAGAHAVESMLGVLREMLDAESLQLERRGTPTLSHETYLTIARGKTASLFRWGLGEGARTAGAPGDHVAALARFGEAFGVAFQIVDDTLDLVGDPAVVGKGALTDLLEGKATLPLILAAERAPSLATLVADTLAQGITDGAAAQIVEEIVRHGGLDAARREVELHTTTALACLRSLPPSDARELLEATVIALTARAS